MPPQRTSALRKSSEPLRKPPPSNAERLLACSTSHPGHYKQVSHTHRSVLVLARTQFFHIVRYRYAKPSAPSAPSPPAVSPQHRPRASFLPTPQRPSLGGSSSPSGVLPEAAALRRAHDVVSGFWRRLRTRVASVRHAEHAGGAGHKGGSAHGAAGAEVTAKAMRVETSKRCMRARTPRIQSAATVSLSFTSARETPSPRWHQLGL